MAETSLSRRRIAAPAASSFARWSKPFLAELAATSNVSAAARAADISTTTAYDTRRASADFRRRWEAALCEGYEHLEMELLGRLRTGEVKPASGAKSGVRTFDNATALRLLTVHREAAARGRGARSHQEAEAVIQSINAKLEKMRQRELAAAAAQTIEGSASEAPLSEALASEALPSEALASESPSDVRS